jgi:hypothetical protein
MALYKRRMELRRLAEAEARGEAFWTHEFGRDVRVKIERAYRRAASYNEEQPVVVARELLLDDVGEPFLSDSAANAWEDFFQYFDSCDDESFASAVEGLVVGMVETDGRDRFSTLSPERFSEETNHILAEHRVSYEMVDGMMVSFESKEMHTAVVVPTLLLLSGRHGWEDVEESYQDALGELARGNPGNAITDAARALEATFDHLDIPGNSLGARASMAKERGLIPSQDSKLFDWVNAARGNLSDAHPGSEATPGDAWLAVHVVGALILRLVGAT